MSKIVSYLKREVKGNVIIVASKRWDNYIEKNILDGVLKDDREVMQYSKIHSNPTYKDLQDLREWIDTWNCDFETVISIGGGSTMDLAKGIVSKDMVHIAIPTTTGTGSEVTRYSVLTYKGRKKTFEMLKPTNYILDIDLVKELGKNLRQFESSLCDCLCQAIESFWSSKATKKSTKYSKKSIKLFLRFMHGGDSSKNAINKKFMDILEASNYAGKAIQITGTNVCHSLSYYLTTKHNIPHGKACIIFLADIMYNNALYATSNKDYKKILELAKLFNCKDVKELRERFMFYAKREREEYKETLLKVDREEWAKDILRNKKVHDPCYFRVEVMLDRLIDSL